MRKLIDLRKLTLENVEEKGKRNLARGYITHSVKNTGSVRKLPFISLWLGQVTYISTIVSLAITGRE